MGTSSSRPNVCPYCAVRIKLPEGNDNNTSSSQSNDQLIFNCSRCNGAIKFKSSKQLEFERYPQPIQYVHIAPFADDSLFEELKISNSDETIDDMTLENEEMDEEMRKAIKMSMEQDLDTILITDYLKPYFNHNSKVPVRKGTRFITKNIEFKVFACYPPYGFVTNATEFMLTDIDNQLIKLQSRPIHRIHILPTNASLFTYSKDNKVEIKNANDLFKSHIQEYLAGNDCEFFLKSRSIFEEEKDDNIRSKQRYLMESETFLYKNVLFAVMKCEPCSGYIDLRLTQIFCDGNALRDIESIDIRPIFDQLPCAHHDLSSQEIENYYLKQYFYGKCRYIDAKNDNDILRINDVTFMVNACVPKSGIITCGTHIGNAAPIQNSEILEIQQRKDEEYALQLQRELNGNNMNRMSAYRYGNMNNMNNMNMNDPFMQFIRLLDQFHEMRVEMDFEQKENNDNNKGIDLRLINTLPTYKYAQKTKDASDSSVESCRICLGEYENDEELRALPCFHSFHKDCIDQWLHINEKCPVCKTSVTHNR